MGALGAARLGQRGGGGGGAVARSSNVEERGRRREGRFGRLGRQPMQSIGTPVIGWRVSKAVLKPHPQQPTNCMRRMYPRELELRRGSWQRASSGLPCIPSRSRNLFTSSPPFAAAADDAMRSQYAAVLADRKRSPGAIQFARHSAKAHTRAQPFAPLVDA
jgi:hypothetical protein